jgi:hypothetical protein
VTKEGFATSVQPDVELQVNQDLEANYTLAVGTVTQRVEVTGAAAMLKTASATLGQVVNSQEAVELPLNGRQFTELVLLTPGAAPKEGNQQTYQTVQIGAGGLSPSSNGQAGFQNVFTIDGVWDNNFFLSQYTISPPPDAIREFNVQSHITDAQFSVSTGANVNLVTKSGTDQLHGDLWEFLRNSDLDAASPIDNNSNAPKGAYRQNQYGFTLGGPVILPGYDGRQKHTYFFGYWEGYKSVKDYTEDAVVPTTAELGGDFSSQLTSTPSGQLDDLGRPILNGQIFNPYTTRQVTAGSIDPVTGLMATSTGLVREPFAGNQIPSGMLTSQALAYLNVAIQPANTTGAYNSVISSPFTVSSNQFSVGLDHTFGNNDTLSGKFYDSNSSAVFANNVLLGAGLNTSRARLV